MNSGRRPRRRRDRPGSRPSGLRARRVLPGGGRRRPNWGPFDRNLYELSDAEKAALEHLPKTLYEALDALEADHDFLTCGGVFPQRLIELWQKLLRRETAELERIPTPAEFERYYDL